MQDEEFKVTLASQQVQPGLPNTVSRNNKREGWGDSSEVTSTGHSSRGAGFDP